MSNTRHATGGGSLRQERFASSPEFERGLSASMVARRCSVLDDPADRELIWFLQYLSHRPGGLKSFAAELLAKFGDRVGTKTMATIGKPKGQTYNADQVRAIRNELPRDLKKEFPLRGEKKHELNRLAAQAEHARWLKELRECGSEDTSREKELAAARRESDNYPNSYPAEVFSDLCRKAAESGLSHNWDANTQPLENHLQNLCLDPAWQPADWAPWFFNHLTPTLREYMAQWTIQRSAGVVVTALGEKVHEVLDYTLHSGKMTLVEGIARIGKSFSARSRCEQHPGRMRFIEVPTGNDETSFYRTLARGLGLGTCQQYKAAEIRERVESVLLCGAVLICLDEAQRLLPQVNFRYGYPKRIEWLLSMVNAGVPVCLISQPGFVERLSVLSENTGWNPSQFIGRLAHREDLPQDLSLEDLTAVARSVLPDADKPTLRALAAHARTSGRYLAAIETVTSRAKYIAGRQGRNETTPADVRRAMKESIASDSKIVASLGTASKPRRPIQPAAPAQQPAEDVATPWPSRGIAPENQTNRIASAPALATI